MFFPAISSKKPLKPNSETKLVEETLEVGGSCIPSTRRINSPQHKYGDGQVLGYLLAEMENNAEKTGVPPQEKSFEHNPRLPSRVLYKLKYTDEDDELLLLLEQQIERS